MHQVSGSGEIYCPFYYFFNCSAVNINLILPQVEVGEGLVIGHILICDKGRVIEIKIKIPDLLDSSTVKQYGNQLYQLFLCRRKEKLMK